MYRAYVTISLLVLSLSSTAMAKDTLPQQEGEKAAATNEAPASPEQNTEAKKPVSLLDELKEEMDSSTQGWEVIEGSQAPTYPYVEHNGYFRFRADYFLRPHLGVVGRTINPASTVGTSGVLPPLSQNVFNAENEASQLNGEERSEESMAGANIRLRYSPIFHVDDWLRIHSTLDILDNLVLGSTPDYAPLRADTPFALFSGSQAPPTEGRNSTSDGIRVKEAFANVDTIFGNLRVGRMASHWGLGILANGGAGIDADYGDYVDRVLFTTRLGGVYLAGAWDFVSEGVLASDSEQYFGQAYDADQLDDVNQVVAAIFQRPLSDEEKERRQRDLYELHRPVFDWGLYAVYRTQDYDITSDKQPTYENPVSVTNYDKFKFVKRKAWGVIPDMWARFLWSPGHGQLLRIETEWSMVIGHMESSALDVGDDPGEKDIEQWGGAVEIEYEPNANVSVFLDGGVASGDDAEYFGVLDSTNYADTTGSSNTKVTNFKFDRGYNIDLILFREVLGAVTNAWYIKPGVEYDLFDSQDDDLGFRVDILTAFAMEPEATPGNKSFYGVEFDASMFYEERNRFRADLAWGTLVPGEAFDLVDGFKGADGTQGVTDFAMTVQARLFILF